MRPDFYSAHIFNVQPDLWIPAPFDGLVAALRASVGDQVVEGALLVRVEAG